jgi:soluble lytic murein transglycosylase-like protein
MTHTWRTLDDGRIEVDGSVPTVAAGARLATLQSVIAKWGPLIEEQSQRTGVPRAWIGAIITVESAGNPAAESPVGALGLMQLMPPNWKGHSRAEIMDARINATLGVDMLDVIRRTQRPGNNGPDLVKVASTYNGGSDNAQNEPRKRSGDPWGLLENAGYIDQVIANSNTLIALHGSAWGGTALGPKVQTAPGILILACLYALAKWSRAF